MNLMRKTGKKEKKRPTGAPWIHRAGTAWTGQIDLSPGRNNGLARRPIGLRMPMTEHLMRLDTQRILSWLLCAANSAED